MAPGNTRGFSRFPQGGYLITLSQSSVPIQIVPESRPSTPSWLGEVAVFAQVLTHLGLLKAIQMHVRFARARFGHYDLIDFVVVLIGYVVSGEPTLLAFYERLTPFAEPFMALFGRASASPSLDALPLSCGPGSSQRGSASFTLSGGSACTQTVCLPWWIV